jgi:SRSO17 transposase
MLTRALEAGVPFGWVAADEAYGQDGKFRTWLEAHQIAHVLAVPRTQTVIGADLRAHRAHALVAGVPAHAWERRSAGHGAKGPRCYDWAVIAIRPLREPGWAHWLLARRSLTDPTEIAYYLAYAPQTTTLAELVRVAGARWAVEECFQTAKGEVGLDHYQVRRHQPWHRHITLAMAAAAFLAVTRAKAQPAKGAPPLPGQASSG